METNNMTLEEAFAQLDETLKNMERRDITLEESFAAYAQGMELLKVCNERIDSVEKRVQQINEEGELRDYEL